MRYLHHRFGLPLIFACVSVAAFAILRLVLLAYSWTDVNAHPWLLAKVFVIGGIYDLAALCYFAIPFWIYLALIPNRWYQKPWHRALTWFVFAASVYGMLFECVAEYFFWDEFGVRFNFISVDYLVYRQEVTGNIWESYPVVPLLAAIAVVTLAICWGVRKHVHAALASPMPRTRRFVAATGWLLLPAIVYAAIDGRLQNLSDNRFDNELAGNGFYQFVHAFRHNELDYDQFYLTADPAKLDVRLRALVNEKNAHFLSDAPLDIRRRIDNGNQQEPVNVMLVMVESLSASYLGVYGGKGNLTPYLDQLSNESLWFSRLYATGTRTVRGMEAATLSMPPTAGQSIVRRPHNEHLPNLGRVFQERGYDTRFIYGGHGYFDNMNAFFAGNGFEILDRTDIPDDEVIFSNVWGVADEVLFNQAIKAADKSFAAKKPFFHFVMTTTNHRPYTYPDGRIDIESPHKGGAVKYTDYAIHKLLEDARTKPWFKNTVFVILADHCASSAGKSELPVKNYLIPMFIYAPELVKPAKIETLASQMDLAPTLLGLLGYDYDSEFMGKNVLEMKPDEGRALISTYQALGLLTDHELEILWPQRKIERQLDPFGKPTKNISADAPATLPDAVVYYQAASARWRRHVEQQMKAQGGAP
ncbi:MAG: sulfatase-like hydrolase/transferase [Gammaproteobacteria bacterium]|nr:sulfatase-like hydrolase/transferase [Gammaproteobacteria bacterium]